MIKKIKAFLFIALAVAVVSPVLSASAVSEEATTTESSETTAQDAATLQTTATTPEAEPTANDRASGREERVKAYKEKVKEKLSAVKEKRITSKCEAAQEKVTSLRTRVQTIIANRKKAYQTISEKLDTAVEKLKKAGVDTTKLEAAREDIRAKLVSLDENMNAYDTVLADLETMDCAADPATFVAALESARETQKSLREQAQEFRKIATTELKTLLEEAKNTLATKTEANTNATTDGGTQ
jgi:ABC-type transporter Mla subunit MlaD